MWYKLIGQQFMGLHYAPLTTSCAVREWPTHSSCRVWMLPDVLAEQIRSENI